MKITSFPSAVDTILSGCPLTPPILTAGVYEGTWSFVYLSAFQRLLGSLASSRRSSVGKTPSRKLSQASCLAFRMC